MLLHGGLPLAWGGAVVVPTALTVSGAVYARGWHRCRRRIPARFTPRQLAAFLGGIASLWVAIASPLEQAADARLSAHMVQHICCSP